MMPVASNVVTFRLEERSRQNQRSRKLNKETIASLPQPEKGNTVTYFKDAVTQGKPVPSGFGVRVTANGAKAFVLNYRAGGIARRLTIGSTDSWSIPEAVKRAHELRRQIDRGEDPLAKEPAAPEPRTVADLIRDYTSADRTWLKRPDIGDDALTRLLLPEIGHLPLMELRRSDIMPALDRITAAIAKRQRYSGKTTRKNLLSYFRAAWSWEEEADENLPAFPGPPKRSKRHTVEVERPGRDLTDDELRRLWRAWEGDVFGDICKVLLLTGQRRNEVSRMPWSEISTDGRLWVIPASRYKTKRQHVVPLTEPVRAIIEAHKNSSSLVFRTKTGTAVATGGNDKVRIDKNLKGTPPINWVVHDLRHTAETLMARAGVDPFIIERVTGHALPTAMMQRYQHHSFEDEKRSALEKLAALVLEIVSIPEAPSIVPEAPK